MVDYLKYHEFKELLSKVEFNKNIRYFKITVGDRHSTWHHYYLELDESFKEFFEKHLGGYHKFIIPFEDKFIKMIHFQRYDPSGLCYGGEVIRAIQSWFISFLDQKKILQLITPNCNQGRGGYDLIREIGNNQEFYFNEMKKKNIITELNDITKNYCNKINILESKLRNKNDKLKDLENKYNKIKQEHLSICIINTDLENENKRYHEKVNNLECNNNTLKEEYKRVCKIRNDFESKNDLIKDELEETKKQSSKKDKLNKRLVNLLTIYKYHEFNNVEKYDYNSIKEKNKKLNSEFKRVAKLMKLC